jgi:hypothetical protein
VRVAGLAALCVLAGLGIGLVFTRAGRGANELAVARTLALEAAAPAPRAALTEPVAELEPESDSAAFAAARASVAEPVRAPEPDARRAAASPAALNVLVLDAGGRARPDVEVALLRIEGGRESVLERAQPAELPYTHRLQQVQRRLAEPSRGSLAIGVLAPHARAPRERLWPETLDALGAEALVLRLEPAAGLRVLVLERAGGPALVRGSLRLALRGAERESRAALVVEFDGPAVDVHGLEPERGLDLELRVSGRATVSRKLRTGRAGESTEITLELAPPGPRIALQLCGPDGLPLVRQRVRLTCRAPALQRVDATLRTDAEGRVDWNLAPREHAPQAVLTVSADLPVGRSSARIELAPLPASGALEVGRVALQLEPLLASGVVTDLEGRALRGARVRIQARSEGGDVLGSIETRTRAGGRFELHGKLPAGQIGLRASAAGHLDARVADLVLPLADRVLKLEPAAALAGRIAAPAGFPLESLTLELTGSDRSARTLSVAPDGSFSLAGIAPGRLDLAARVGREEPCARVARLELLAGGTCRDERIQPLDLRREVGIVAFEVCSADGEPIPLARLRVHDREAAPGRAAGIRDWTARAGRVELPTARRSVDVEIHAAGHAARRERALVSGARVVLDPALRVRVELGARLPALEQGRSLWAAFAPELPLEDELAQFSRVEIERSCRDSSVRIGREGNSAALTLPAAGRYELRVYFGKFRDPQRSRQVFHRTVSITPRAGLQPIRLRLDAASLANWVRAPSVER